MQQKETRLLVGGIDSDTAPHFIKDGALLNAVNMALVKRGTQDSAALDMLAGTQLVGSINTLLPNGGPYTLIGHCQSEERNCIYLFIYSPYDNTADPELRNMILEYNNTTGTARIILDEDDVTGGLGFTATMFISAVVASGIIAWTNNTNDIRYANLGFTYHNSGPYDEYDLSLITEPPHVPLTSGRGSTTGGSSTIQFKSIQFTYRFVNQEGFVSVLAPLSLTSFATRESDAAINSDSGNSLDIAIPYDQKIPKRWKYIEMVVRFPDTNSYYVINRWSASVPADVSAVALHNAASSPLQFNGWSGVLQEQLDGGYTEKQFDNLPDKAFCIEAAANRLMIANMTEGRDTPGTVPTASFTTTSYNINQASGTVYPLYLIAIMKHNVDQWYFAIVLQISGKYYLPPKECSVGIFKHSSMPTPTGASTQSFELTAPLIMVPESISASQLTELKSTTDDIGLITYSNSGVTYNPPLDLSIEDYSTTAIPLPTRDVISTARKSLVLEAHGLTEMDTALSGSDRNYWMFEYGSINVEDPAPEYGVASESRAFLPKSRYKIGFQLYDGALRKCGNSILTDFTPAPYDVFNAALVEKVNITIPNTTVPSWARYYSVTLSRNNRTNQFIQFRPDVCRILVRNKDGDIRPIDPSSVTSVPAGYSIYGIGIPIGSISNQGYGYAFKEGDFIDYSVTPNGGTQSEGTAQVIGEEAGMLIVRYTSGSTIADMCCGVSETLTIIISAVVTIVSGVANASLGVPGASLQSQNRTIITLNIGKQTDNNYYEVAAFGLVSANTTGNFISTGNTTISIYGDCHTQKRESQTGSATCLSFVTYEPDHSYWATDLGRVTPFDTIGRKTMPTAVRWSNTHIPGANSNGFASFDALDIKFVDETAGDIKGLKLTTLGAQDGGQMLVICTNGSFTTLVGQQQIYDASGNTGINIAANVIGDFNALKGNYGCSSPRSIERYRHLVFWVDAYNNAIIEFDDSGAHSVSAFKNNRLFDQMLRDAKAKAGAVDAISCGVNPYTKELMVSIRIMDSAPLTPLATTQDPNGGIYFLTGLEQPFNAYVRVPSSFCYNWENNTWTTRYKSGAQFMNLGNDVFSWHFPSQKFYKEFVGTSGAYYNDTQSAMIAIPFNGGYPAIKSPLSLRIVSDRPPTTTWLRCMDGSTERVANTQAWEKREGEWVAAIRRDRTTGGASSASEWSAAGISGRRLKGVVVDVAMIWEGSDPINISSATLVHEISSGHP